MDNLKDLINDCVTKHLVNYHAIYHAFNEGLKKGFEWKDINNLLYRDKKELILVKCETDIDYVPTLVHLCSSESVKTYQKCFTHFKYID